MSPTTEDLEKLRQALLAVQERSIQQGLAIKVFSDDHTANALELKRCIAKLTSILIDMEEPEEPEEPGEPPVHEASFLYAPSFFVEGGYPTDVLPTTANISCRQDSTAVNRYSWYVPPWANAGVWTETQIMGLLTKLVEWGYRGVMIDMENAFWYTDGYMRRWADCMARRSGLLFGVGPKYSLGELSRNPHVDVGTTNQDAFCDFLVGLGVDAVCAWGYGPATIHQAAYVKLRKYFRNDQIMLLQDHFRNWDGYIGLTEFPKLVKWAKSFAAGLETRPLIGLFQTHRDPNASTRKAAIAALTELYD